VRAIEPGFTVAEVLVAVMVLTVGVLALVGSFAGMSRMLGQGRQATVAAAVTAGRMEELRRIAHSTSPPCTAPEWRSDSASETGVAESWQVLDPEGITRRVQLIVRYRTPAGFATDTAVMAVLCEPA
jgi:Tfp pilus assembly protein PilV